MAQGKAAAGFRLGVAGCAFEELQPCSVIVLVVNIVSVFSGEREGHSPVAADRYGPTAFAVALELMQSQAPKRHVFRSDCRLQLRQDEAKPLGLFWSDARLSTRQKEPLQPLMLEAPDYLRSVTSRVTHIKTPNVKAVRPDAAGGRSEPAPGWAASRLRHP